LLEAGAKIAKKTMIEKHVQRYQARDSCRPKWSKQWMRGIMLTGGMQQKGLTYERSASKNAAAAQRDEMAATKMIGRNWAWSSKWHCK